jgi:copper chaperone CopZ
VKTERLALKCTKGVCPDGQGFCCLPDQRRLESSLKGVKGVTEVIPDKRARTFTVISPKGQVALADLQAAAQEAGFEVVEARRLD